MKVQLFLVKDLAIHFYYSEDSLVDDQIIVKKLFLVFPGLPNPIDKDFFKDKVNKDIAYMSVYFFGTWLSGRKFTPKTSKKSVEAAIEFAKTKIGIKTFDESKIRWDFNKLSIIGYSFAGNIILTTKLNMKDIDEILLYSPLIYVNKKDFEKIVSRAAMEKDITDAINFLNFTKRGFKFALKGITDKSWGEYFSGIDKESIINLPIDYPNIKIFHGKADDQVNYKYSEYFAKIYPFKTSLNLYEGFGHTKDLVKIEDLVK